MCVDGYDGIIPRIIRMLSTLILLLIYRPLPFSVYFPTTHHLHIMDTCHHYFIVCSHSDFITSRGVYWMDSNPNCPESIVYPFRLCPSIKYITGFHPSLSHHILATVKCYYRYLLYRPH